MHNLTVEDLAKTYSSKKEDVVAVDGVDLEVDEGEMLVLLGPSGCGKTTILRSIAGLERPTRGRIKLGTRSLFDAELGIDIAPNRRGLGLVFQTYALWPHMTVRKNIAYPLRAQRMRNELRSGWAEEAAATVELAPSLLDRYPSQLSGGQQQRVALARALSARPALLLFDEPLSNLDAQLRLQLRAELRSLHQRLSFTGVYVTHDQSEALALGTRIAVMDTGVIVQIGSPEEIFRSPATSFVAGFVGATNTLPLIPDGSRWKIDGASVRGLGRSGNSVSGLDLRFRPEHVAFGHEGMNHQGVTICNGTIASKTFGGTYTDYHVKIGGTTIHAQVSHRRIEGAPLTVSIGDEVTLQIEAANVLLYDEDAQLVHTTYRDNMLVPEIRDNHR